jgi:hypothetical protein
VLLGSIFTTALVLRMPFGPAPIEDALSVIDARALDAWSASPVTSMDPPAPASQIAAEPKTVQPKSTLVPVRMYLTSIRDHMPLEVSPRRPALSNQQPVAVTEPPLPSTPQTYLSVLAAPVVPVSSADSTSRPFGVVGGAVGTAFAKTGAALTLAFKKTGQGILAPF